MTLVKRQLLAICFHVTNFCFVFTSMFLPLTTQAASNSNDWNAKTKEYVGVLQEGRENESLGEFFQRIGNYIPKEVRRDFGPELKNKGHLPAPNISVEDNEIVFKQNDQKIRMKIESLANEQVVYINGEKLKVDDFKSVKILLSRIESIAKKTASSDNVMRPALFAKLSIPFALFLPKAHADIDWMPLLLGAGLGAAGGYFLSSTFGVSSMTGALVGGALGLGAGLLWNYFKNKKCSKTVQCCWAGGTSIPAWGKSGECCTDKNLSQVQDSACQSPTSTTTTTPASTTGNLLSDPTKSSGTK